MSSTEDMTQRAEALLEELWEVGIRPTSLEHGFGFLLVQALEDVVPVGRFADRPLHDLLFHEWTPDEHGFGGFVHFMQELLSDGYRDRPTVPVDLLTQAMIINAAVRCDPPERVLALFAEEADFRARGDEYDGDPEEPLHWADEWRRMFATKGWCPSELPDPKGWQDRDCLMDRCRACGKLRREGLVIDTRFGDPEERLDDPCISDLPGVQFACCGHGHSGRGVYVDTLSGPAAAERMRELGGNPPAAAFLEPEAEGSTT
jgi:hypothetical protein